MPLPTEGNIAIAFADFKASYKILDRSGIRVLRDPFTDKPFVKFYTTKRVGGDMMNFSAVKLLKISGKTK
jgi:HK97 family phage major capsid protein